MLPLRRSLPRGRRELLLRSVVAGAEMPARGPARPTRRSLLARAAMRTRETMERRAVALEGPGPILSRAGEPALPPLGVVLLNRAGLGPRPGDLAAFEALRVQGSNNDGVWNEEELALAIEVTAPLWMTWWFNGMLVVVAGGLLYRIHIARTRSIQRRAPREVPSQERYRPNSGELPEAATPWAVCLGLASRSPGPATREGSGGEVGWLVMRRLGGAAELAVPVTESGTDVAIAGQDRCAAVRR